MKKIFLGLLIVGLLSLSFVSADLLRLDGGLENDEFCTNSTYDQDACPYPVSGLGDLRTYDVCTNYIGNNCFMHYNDSVTQTYSAIVTTASPDFQVRSQYFDTDGSHSSINIVIYWQNLETNETLTDINFSGSLPIATPTDFAFNLSVPQYLGQYVTWRWNVNGIDMDWYEARVLNITDYTPFVEEVNETTGYTPEFESDDVAAVTIDFTTGLGVVFFSFAGIIGLAILYQFVFRRGARR